MSDKVKELIKAKDDDLDLRTKPLQEVVTNLRQSYTNEQLFFKNSQEVLRKKFD